MVKHLPRVHFNEEIFENDIALTTQRNEAKMIGKEVEVSILMQATS